MFPSTELEYVAALEPYIQRLTLRDLRVLDPLDDSVHLRLFIAVGFDLLCISINREYHFEDVIHLVNSLPHQILAIVGGKQAGDSSETILERCLRVDAVVTGKGEAAKVEITSGVDWHSIEDISCRRGRTTAPNSPRPPLDFAALSFPKPHQRARPYRFNVGGFAFRREELDVLLTSHGCSYNCKFCKFGLSSGGVKLPYATRCIDSVVDELAAMMAGVLLIGDENFFVHPDRVAKICECILSCCIRKRYLVQSRIEIAQRPDVLALAMRAGVKMLLLGIEPPTDRILQMQNKGFESANLVLAFETLRRFPLYYHGGFIYGKPTETAAEMLEIPEFSGRLSLDSITCQTEDGCGGDPRFLCDRRQPGLPRGPGLSLPGPHQPVHPLPLLNRRKATGHCRQNHQRSPVYPQAPPADPVGGPAGGGSQNNMAQDRKETVRLAGPGPLKTLTTDRRRRRGPDPFGRW